MIRGTFANIRLKNLLLSGVEGGFTKNFLAGGEQTTIYEASMAYQSAGIPLIILAGKEYGSGSSRDWVYEISLHSHARDSLSQPL